MIKLRYEDYEGNWYAEEYDSVKTARIAAASVENVKIYQQWRDGEIRITGDDDILWRPTGKTFLLKHDDKGMPLPPETQRSNDRDNATLWMMYDRAKEAWDYKHGVKTENADEWWTEFNRRLDRVKKLGTMAVDGYGCPFVATAWIHWRDGQFVYERVMPRQWVHMDKKTRIEVLDDVCLAAELLEMTPYAEGEQWHNDFGIRLS